MKQGTVIKVAGNIFSVRTDAGDCTTCYVKGRLRIEGLRATSPAAVGDRVDFERSESGPGLIARIHPRKNYIIRKAVKKSSEVQVIASNIDQALLMVSLVSPKTLTGFIDRFLVTAEAYRIPVILVFNKTDLYGKKEQEELAYFSRTYTGAGYKCMHTSVTENKNIDSVKDTLKNKITLLSGNSGVGKSSMLNLIQPDLYLKTDEISSAHDTGKHVTTFAEMITMGNNARIIDTPGVKSFGIVDFYRNELFHYFPEMFSRSKECKFNDCTHIKEPKCAVKRAVESGEIASFRYENYLKIFRDEDMDVEYDD
ncbi:MAG: ribosome small subunit-dependent GTPase A [Bacteroidetes bacterium]|nr:ribosome small subunit-dependent GTPase A [Bacteroidota bacterium]